MQLRAGAFAVRRASGLAAALAPHGSRGESESRAASSWLVLQVPLCILLSVALYFASYGYSSAAQRASTGAVPRLRTLTNGHGLLEMMGTGASDDSATG